MVSVKRPLAESRNRDVRRGRDAKIRNSSLILEWLEIAGFVGVWWCLFADGESRGTVPSAGKYQVVGLAFGGYWLEGVQSGDALVRTRRLIFLLTRFFI